MTTGGKTTTHAGIRPASAKGSRHLWSERWREIKLPDGHDAVSRSRSEVIERHSSTVLLERVGNVFEEYEPKNDVFVFRCVHVVAQLVRGQPELGLKTDGGGRWV